MKKGLRLLSALTVALLTGCATPDQVCRIRSLSDVTDPSNRQEWSGSFPGIADTLASSKSNHLNVLFVHGIGWTQKGGEKQFAFDLAEVLAKHFGSDDSWKSEQNLTKLCPRSTLGSEVDAKQGGGVTLTSTNAKNRFISDDPEMQLQIYDLGCLDRLQLKTRDGSKTVSIYRFFWDDALWDGIEWPHMGYDDPAPRRSDGTKDHQGYDDPDALRRDGSAGLKNELFTWGLIDAAAYIGPAGAFAREGMRAAICLVAGASTNSDFMGVAAVEERDQGDGTTKPKRVISSKMACDPSRVPSAPLVLMSHSLGSRLVFDTLIGELEPDFAASINKLPMDRLNVYMLANQIPLMATGRITEPRGVKRQASLTAPPRFVAFSEINDPLTYELVPYFEHMHYLRDRKKYTTRRIEALQSKEQRTALTRELGFDVVDVRVSFARYIPIPSVGELARPDDAHSGMLSLSSKVPALLIGGVQVGGKPTDGSVGKGECAPRMGG